MSKNIQNDETNETQPKSQKGYSLRERSATKKNINYIKLNLEGENDSYESKVLKKKRRSTEYINSNYFECSFDGCRKKFYDRSAFHKHQLTHGDKLFSCKDCGKKFLDNSKLRRHSLVHTGEKPFKCEICNKRFSLDFNLRTHMRIHTGEKPYACTYPGCFKRFSQSSNLNAHEKTHEVNKDNYSNTGYTNYGDYQTYQSQQRPIFAQNPLKLIMFNHFSGPMTLHNLFEINKLYEMMKEGLNNQLYFGNNPGYINVNMNMKYQQNNVYRQQNGYYNNHSNNNMNDEKSKNEYSNIILDTTYNSEDPITRKNMTLQMKRPIFGVYRIINNFNNPYMVKNYNVNYNEFQNNNYNPYNENINSNNNTNIFENNNYTNTNENLNMNNNIENTNNNCTENTNKKVSDTSTANNAYNHEEKNVPPEQGLNASQQSPTYNNFQGQDQYYYNNNNNNGQFNAESSGRHNPKYRDEERNESENEEGDGYFKSLQWEN